MKPPQNTVIVIAGPTAVGKTALSLQLAREFQTSIISADSRQCFTELNIGVAKPSVEELNEVQHYFINSHSIHDDVNAGTFEQYALDSAEELFKKHAVVVMVGGTGLYIKAFCEGMDDMPQVPPSIRQMIIAGYETAGLQWLQEEVQKNDPEFWRVAEQQNPQRLMRALEVKLATGESIVHFRKGTKASRPFNIIKIGLELPRELLYRNVNHRVDIMMHQGLAEEVRSLMPYQHLNALQTVGYSELFAFFNNQCTLDESVEKIKTNTRHYAKRQMTWFKKDQSLQWFHPQALDEVMDFVKEKT
ncbi:tRNA (adenosine(37)-N6)-dimethylallyltransferase MiaA [Danxiaibacter flavus]|uniref:tRNA dimethylallyltransferase n=1 Tax=Danxiaibacter flavus TaxID=3049108 RepID=A0ABV3ZB61_9BACT|nr:tRNA (adenosine(37)-N6)-dimethylallyltransferase MiaA [Chitinophagaceae bacterium DXS]